MRAHVLAHMCTYAHMHSVHTYVQVHVQVRVISYELFSMSYKIGSLTGTCDSPIRLGWPVSSRDAPWSLGFIYSQSSFSTLQFFFLIEPLRMAIIFFISPRDSALAHHLG